MDKLRPQAAAFLANLPGTATVEAAALGGCGCTGTATGAESSAGVRCSSSSATMRSGFSTFGLPSTLCGATLRGCGLRRGIQRPALGQLQCVPAHGLLIVSSPAALLFL